MKRKTRTGKVAPDRADEGPKTETPAEVVARLKALAAKANGGDGQALADLRRMLDERPGIWQHLGNLTALAERAWIAAAVGTDPLTVESLKRQVAQMKADLGGPHPTPSERLLVDQVVVSWLAMQQAEMSAAQPGDSTLGQGALRGRRVESAQKRYLSAVRMLTQLRATMPQGLTPLNSMRVHDAKRQRA
jgi:hypothetical protein